MEVGLGTGETAATIFQYGPMRASVTMIQAIFQTDFEEKKGPGDDQRRQRQGAKSYWTSSNYSSKTSSESLWFT